MTKPMNTAIPQLKIIISQPLCVQQTISVREAPENINTRSETNLRMAKNATAKLTAKTVSSFFSKYACWLATFSTSNLQSKFQTNKVSKTWSQKKKEQIWLVDLNMGLSKSRKQEQGQAKRGKLSYKRVERATTKTNQDSTRIFKSS